MLDSNQQKIKILLVSPLPTGCSFGGIGSWTIRFVDALKQKNNFEIKVVNSIPIDKNGKDIARSKNLLKKLSCNLRVLKTIKKELSDFKPDIVHLNSSCTPFACIRDFLFIKAIRKKHIKSILHCRCNIEDQLHGNKIGLFYFKKNIATVSAVWVLNDASNQFVKHKLKNDTKVYIIPNFIDESHVAYKKNIKQNVSNIVFVGHLVKQKGISEIINVAKIFPNKKFILVSGFTEEFPSSYIFPKNIVITGNISLLSVFKKLDESDLFILPTYSEGFSNALLEAMARGLPIITTNVGANMDMIENKGGLIVSPKSTEQLVDALKKVESKDLREKMSVWNICKVKNTYTANAVLDKIINNYYILLDGKGINS